MQSDPRSQGAAFVWPSYLFDAFDSLPRHLDPREFTNSELSSSIIQCVCVNYKVAYDTENEIIYLTLHLLDGRSVFLSVMNILHPFNRPEVKLKAYDGAATTEEISGAYSYGGQGQSVENVMVKLRHYAMQMFQWLRARQRNEEKEHPFKVVTLAEYRQRKLGRIPKEKLPA